MFIILGKYIYMYIVIFRSEGSTIFVCQDVCLYLSTWKFFQLLFIHGIGVYSF